MNFFSNRTKVNGDIKQEGFTLTEIIIYVGLLAIFTIAVMNIFINITKVYKNVHAVRKIENTALFTMDRMTREIKNASTIDSANTIWGTSTVASLSLNTTNASGTSEILRFYKSGPTIYMNRNGSLVGPLSSNSVVVSTLKFEQVVASSSESVKVTLTLETGTSTTYFSKTFYNTATLRGSY